MVGEVELFRDELPGGERFAGDSAFGVTLRLGKHVVEFVGEDPAHRPAK